MPRRLRGQDDLRTEIVAPRGLPEADLVVLAPAFVELSNEGAERAVDALAELLADAAERAGEAGA